MLPVLVIDLTNQTDLVQNNNKILTRDVRRTVKYKGYLGGMTLLGKVCAQPHLWELHGTKILVQTSKSPSKNRVMRCSPVDRFLFVCLRMKRTIYRGEQELVKLLEMKEDCNAEDSS